MYDTIPEVVAVMRELFAKFGDESLADRTTVIFNSRMTSCAGTAKSSNRTINLSLALWRRATTKQRRELIIHEACHIYAEHRCGPQIKSHGAEWRYFMAKAGLEPNVHHRVEPLDRFYIHCQCGKEACSKRTINQIMAEEAAPCPKCHTQYRLIADMNIHRNNHV